MTLPFLRAVSRSWDRVVDVDAPAAVFAATVADPQHLRVLHPLIDSVTVDVDRIDADADGDVHVVEFAIDERIPLGPFSLHNRYRSRVETRAHAPLALRLFGWSKPSVTVATTWTLSPTTSTSTRAASHTTITAPAWVADFVFRTAARAHDELTAKLAVHVAAVHVAAVHAAAVHAAAVHAAADGSAKRGAPEMSDE